MSINIVQAQNSRWNYGSSPTAILDRIVDEANDEYNIQDSPLERVTSDPQGQAIQGSYPMQYKLANTLDALRLNIVIYLQRAIYIWLALAVIGLILTGFLMVTKSVNETTIDTVKNRVKRIVIGVIILTWFYAILRIMTALIVSIFGVSGWDTGF